MTLAASFKMLSVPDVREKTYEYLEIICDTLNKGGGKISPQKIIDYIKSNYSKDVYLDQMAERFGTSTSYLSRYFKQSVGVNFHRYLSNIRIDEAKKMLALTDKTITEIAQAVGFNNRNIFLRMFKKLEGLNPSEYRSLIQQRNT
jgi:YesN/AraC family two-component response regulator